MARWKSFEIETEESEKERDDLRMKAYNLTNVINAGYLHLRLDLNVVKWQ